MGALYTMIVQRGVVPFKSCPGALDEIDTCIKRNSVENSENKIIRDFETEVGPGVLRSSVQQTFQMRRIEL